MTRIIRRGHAGRYRQDQAFGRPFRLNKHSPQAKGLVGWWPTLGSPTGSSVKDYSLGNRYPMEPGTAPDVIRDGGFGAALEFVAASSEVLYTTSTPVTGVPVTLSCWAWLETMGATNYTMMSLGDTGGSNHYFALLRYNGELVAYSYGSNTAYAAYPTDPPAQMWFNIVGVYRSTENRSIYVNGRTTTPSTQLSVVDPCERLALGVTADSTPYAYLDGRIADARVYNRALNAGEIRDISSPQTRWELYQPIPRVFPVAIEIVDGEIVRVPPLLRPDFEDRARLIAALQL